MKQKTNAVTALTGGIVQLFKKNKVNLIKGGYCDFCETKTQI